MNLPQMDSIQESKAPWNNDMQEPVEIEVAVSVTLSKIVKVKVNDYTRDEDGYNFEDCDLKSAVEDQVILPQDALRCLRNTFTANHSKIFYDLKDWEVDDFAVTEN